LNGVWATPASVRFHLQFHALARYKAGKERAGWQCQVGKWRYNLRMEPILCPHCQRGIEWELIACELRRHIDAEKSLLRSIEARTPVNGERAELLAWLENWRHERGLPPTNLKRRSTAQLRKMRSEAPRGREFRLGRKWKVSH